MENNVMEKDTQAFTGRSNLIVEIKTKQKELWQMFWNKEMAELFFFFLKTKWRGSLLFESNSQIAS